MPSLKALCTCQVWGSAIKVEKKREVKRKSRGYCPLGQPTFFLLGGVASSCQVLLKDERLPSLWAIKRPRLE